MLTSVLGAAYQAATVLRPVETLIAWHYGIPEWHRASVKIVNGFGWTRFLIWCIGPLIKTKHEDRASEQAKYNNAVFGAALIAISEGGFVYVAFLYVVAVVAIAALNRWASAEAANSDLVATPSKRWIVSFCAFMGFMEIPALRALPLSEESRPFDIYSDDEKSRLTKLEG